MTPPRRMILTICMLALLASGCTHSTAPLPATTQPVAFPNPSFPLTTERAQVAIDQMQANPRPLPRPLVVVGGFLDPNLSTPFIASFFTGITRDTTIVVVPIGLCTSFDDCRR